MKQGAQRALVGRAERRGRWGERKSSSSTDVSLGRAIFKFFFPAAFFTVGGGDISDTSVVVYDTRMSFFLTGFLTVGGGDGCDDSEASDTRSDAFLPCFVTGMGDSSSE